MSWVTELCCSTHIVAACYFVLQKGEVQAGSFSGSLYLIDKPTKFTSPLRSCELNFQYFAAL